ncbi:MAG: hypothetical protein RLZZ612_1638 [Pseudomonadota bacterium]
MDHRTLAYSLLAGDGIEIGALHNPAQVPSCCHVSYCDAMSEDDARRSFPELANLPLVHVSHIVNLDHDALTAFADASQDFVILNHVIEHVANPIRVIIECFRVLRDGGKLVMSAPDMRFSFDRDRALTTPAHLWAEYEAGVTEVSDAHYEEFLRAVHPEALADPAVFAGAMISVRDRREHAHVWNSDTFRALLQDVVQRQQIQAHLLAESVGDDNANEYFSIWQKGPHPSAHELMRWHPVNAVAALGPILKHWTDLRGQIHSLSHTLHQTNLAQQALLQENAQWQAQAQHTQAQLQIVQDKLGVLQQEQAALEQKRLALEQTLTHSQQLVTDKDRHIANIEIQLQAAHHTVDDYQRIIEVMQHSRSWRWTKWLRRTS